MGLSPRVRGNLKDAVVALRRLGSIPACAGEPLRTIPSACGAGVYPRVCGGTFTNHTVGLRRRGLSPRVRGNPVSLSSSVTTTGSIPACAGEPHFDLHLIRLGRVYPRVCGGTRITIMAITAVVGLSPRVRGNRSRLDSRLNGTGSIPACAGEPRHPCSGGAATRVYPRVCGGTLSRAWRGRQRRGLSPRVRGNLMQETLCAVFHRSIPACAGEPARKSA